MKLTSAGTIKVEGHNVNYTEMGQWAVSFRGTFVGYADTLDEVCPLIEARREAVRARLAAVEAKAQERKAQQERERAET
jgi:hypothetical protein